METHGPHPSASAVYQTIAPPAAHTMGSGGHRGRLHPELEGRLSGWTPHGSERTRSWRDFHVVMTRGGLHVAETIALDVRSRSKPRGPTARGRRPREVVMIRGFGRSRVWLSVVAMLMNLATIGTVGNPNLAEAGAAREDGRVSRRVLLGRAGGLSAGQGRHVGRVRICGWLSQFRPGTRW